MNEYETINYKGYKIVIYYDEDCESPRTSCDNVATFVCEHQRYNLGDKHDCESAITELIEKYISEKQVIDFFCNVRNAFLDTSDDVNGPFYKWKTHWKYKGKDVFGEEKISAEQPEWGVASDILDELSDGEKIELINKSGKVLLLPISMYEHSGVTLWIGKPYSGGMSWDSCCVGFAYITEDDAKKECMLDPGEKYNHDWKEWAETIINSEMQCYDAYIKGECYGYQVKDEYGDNVDDICGCWGFIGDDSIDEIIKEAKSEIDYHVEHNVIEV